MKIAPVLAVVSFLLALCLGTGEAQLSLSKVLTGKWEGEYQKDPREKFDNARTLVIGKVREEGGKWIVEDAKFGVTGKQLYPIEARLEVAGEEVMFQFTTDVGGLIRLKLSGENLLAGTYARTASIRPTKLKKVE